MGYGVKAVLGESVFDAPGTAALHHALGLLLIRTARQVEGLQELRNAKRLEPGNRRFVYVLGIALNSTGAQEEAVALLESTHDEFPADFDIASALATIYRDRGEIAAALSMSAKLLKRHPANPDVLVLQESLMRIPWFGENIRVWEASCKKTPMGSLPPSIPQTMSYRSSSDLWNDDR